MTSNREFNLQIKGWLVQPFLFACETNRGLCSQQSGLALCV